MGENSDSKNTLGWKWYEFVKYMSPVSALIFGICGFILTIQAFTDFAFTILVLALVCDCMCIGDIIVFFGLQRRKRYAVYLFLLLEFISIVLIDGVMFHNIIRLLGGVIRILLEAYYFSKRIKYLN